MLISKKLSIINMVVIFTIIFAMVLPNAYKPFATSLLILSACIVSNKIVVNKYLRLYFGFFFISLILTCVYIFIGVVNGAPGISVILNFYIYCVSPFLWSIVLIYFVQKNNDKEIINFFIYVVVIASFSVLLYFLLFLNFGESAVAFYGSRGNVNMSESGYSAAIMHVFGTFIFLVGAFFLRLNVVDSLLVRIFVFTCIFLVVIFAGRTALTISLFFAAFVFFFGFFARSLLTGTINFRFILYFLSALAFSLVIMSYVQLELGVDFIYIVEMFIDKVLSGGGAERTNQAISLINGINDNFMVGSGHGIGVDYLRSDNFPWRYELVWLATVFRVGVIGSIIYMSLFLFYLCCFSYDLYKNKLDKYLIFMFGGFITALLASNTNPYIEASSFQWMYILPVIHYLDRRYTNA